MRIGIAIAALVLAMPAFAQTVTQRENTPPRVAAATITATDGTGQTLSAPVMVSAGTGSAGATTGSMGDLSLCATVTGDQAYVVGTSNPLNCTATGRLKVGVSSASNVEPATMPSTTLAADLTGCRYRTPVTWTLLWTGSIGCDTFGNLMTTQRGGASVGTGQISVGTTSTLIAAARPGRQRITLAVGAANTCAFGNTGVTTTTGFPLQPTAGVTLTLDTAAAIYAACSATTTVSYLEQF